MRTVFTLASGRSGTGFLSRLLRKNALGCVVFHEPYLDRGNPTMFGRPIYDHAVGDLDAVRRRIERKQIRVRRCAPRVYIETSHAFLKSWWDLAPEFFPEMRVVHLVRNPLLVARSEANREAVIERWRIPFRTYRGGDGRRYFRWALTGLEPIFGGFDSQRFSRFQWYLIQWIEIENRAIEFLERFGKRASCFTLHSPAGLNDRARVAALLRFLELEPRRETPVISGFQNRTPGRPTVVGPTEEDECRQVMRRIPPEFLQIFRDVPYSSCEWTRWLRK